MVTRCTQRCEYSIPRKIFLSCNYFTNRSKKVHAIYAKAHLVLTNNHVLTMACSIYTVKLARAKLPANAGNFTCSSQVKRSLAQFACVTCSLPVITGKFTCFEAASTSCRTHAHCLRAHVKLLEYHRYFTGSFTCGTHANLPATSMQNCLLLQAKIHATYRQKHWNRRQKYPPNAGKNNCKRRKKYQHNRRQKNLQFHAELPAIAGNLTSHRG